MYLTDSSFREEAQYNAAILVGGWNTRLHGDRLRVHRRASDASDSRPQTVPLRGSREPRINRTKKGKRS